MKRLTIRHLAVALYYLSHRAGLRVVVLGFAVKQINHALTGADIAWQARIGSGLVLYHPTGVVIGPDVVIGADCVIQQGVTLGGLGSDEHPATSQSPIVGSAVRFGAGSRALGPIRIGDGAEIGANAVVVKDVPPNCLAVGVPAVVRPRKSTGQGSIDE